MTSTFDALTTLVAYHYEDYLTVPVVSFFQKRLNLTEDETLRLLTKLKKQEFLDQGCKQTWITEEGRKELERLRKEQQ